MLELVFNDNEKAVMKQGIKYFDNKDSHDVVNIGFMLDIGDISSSIDGHGRRKVFKELWGDFDFTHEEVEDFCKDQINDMKTLIRAGEVGRGIRIWKSNAPYSICGFYYVCNILRNINCPISVVSLSEYELVCEDEIARYTSWGNIEPKELSRYLKLEKELTTIEKQIYSDLWRDLVVENSPLRVIIKGELLSVSENFYDFLIMKNIPENDFSMGLSGNSKLSFLNPK